MIGRLLKLVGELLRSDGRGEDPEVLNELVFGPREIPRGLSDTEHGVEGHDLRIVPPIGTYSNYPE